MAAWCVSTRGGDLSCAIVAIGTVLRWSATGATTGADLLPAPLPMITGWELWACANHYIREHGDGAPIIAAMRADELLAEGDLEGSRVFQGIARRINQLLEGASGQPH